MKNIFLLGLISLFIWSCSDDSSNNTSDNDSDWDIDSFKSSSSIQSSSSQDSLNVELSSAKVESSSSVTNSSSSVTSSSSEKDGVVSCKTEAEDNCIYGTLLDERDGKSYKTVKVKNTWWMAENLNYADSLKTPSLKRKSWCYDNSPDNCEKFGRLYTWAAAIDSVKFATDSENPQECGDGRNCVQSWPDKVQGICPDGWHLPDYDQLANFIIDVGGYATAGVTLKSQSGWYNDGNGSDAIGFNVLPSGIRFENGSFDSLGAVFWGSTEVMSGAITLYFYYDYEYAGLLDQEKSYAFSIRCVKDTSFSKSQESCSVHNIKSCICDEKNQGKVMVDSSRYTYWTCMENPMIYEGGFVWYEQYFTPERVSYDSVKAIDPTTVKKGSFIDERDGKSYVAVTIGRQTWMAENLDYTYCDTTGTELPSSFCYDSLSVGLHKYGQYYNWDAAMVVCPSGWHLPSPDEYGLLLAYVGGEKTAARYLKSTDSWLDHEGTDDYGFSAKATGNFYNLSNKIQSEGAITNLWTNEGHQKIKATTLYMHLDGDNAFLFEGSLKANMNPVRCIKDKE